MITGLNTLIGHLIECQKDKKKFKTGYWSTINEYPIMYALVAIYKSAMVLECGTCAGASTLTWAVAQQNAQLNPRVYTFDPANRNKVYDGTGWEQYIKYYNQPWVCEQSKELLEKNIHGSKLVFIDGNHFEEFVQKDVDHTFPYMKVKDIVVFHDAIKYPPIQDIVNESVKKYNINKNFIIPSSCGFQVVQF